MTAENQENKINADQAIEMLISSSHDINTCWNTFIHEEYNNDYAENKDDLIDIITIVDYIVGRYKEGKTADFKNFFDAVEQILDNCDDSSKELIIIGLIEGLQNNCGLENIDYHTCFNQWLNPKTKKVWDWLIYLWESSDTEEEKQEKMEGFRKLFTDV